jgi:hypothetical protein
MVKVYTKEALEKEYPSDRYELFYIDGTQYTFYILGGFHHPYMINNKICLNVNAVEINI